MQPTARTDGRYSVRKRFTDDLRTETVYSTYDTLEDARACRTAAQPLAEAEGHRWRLAIHDTEAGIDVD